MLISVFREILFALLLLFSGFTCITSSKLSTDCFDKEGLPQPIAIHLGGDTITVAYAHSLSNVTTLAAAHYRATKFPELAEFGNHMSLIRLEYFRQSLGPQLQSQKLSQHFHQTWQILQGYFVALCELWKGVTDDLNFIFIRWINLRLEIISRFLSNITNSTPTPEARVDVSFGAAEFENSMRQAFLLVKAMSLNDTGIEIRSAVIVTPDFFNTSMTEVMQQALFAAGIDLTLVIDRKTALQSYDNPPESTKQFRLLFRGFRGLADDMRFTKLAHMVRSLDERRMSNCKVFLMIDYGQSYLDIQIKGCPCQYNRALDILGFYRITEEVVMRYILNGNATLKQELQHEHLYDRLEHSVNLARRLIHFSCAGTNSTDDDQPCEEWPLALSHSLRTDERINTVLYWDDLQVVEREYVQLIEERVAAAVEQVEEAGCKNDSHPGSFRERLGTAYIIGSYFDGELYQRAVQNALGKDVKIQGGDQDGIYLASFGGARFALAYRTLAELMFESICLDKHHDEL